MTNPLNQIINIFQSGELTSTLTAILGGGGLTASIAILIILFATHKVSSTVLKLFGWLILISVVLILFGFKGEEIAKYFLGIPGELQNFFDTVIKAFTN